MGVGQDLLSCLTRLARGLGLPGFTAEVLVREQVDVRPSKFMGFESEKRSHKRVYEMLMMFREYLRVRRLVFDMV